jgi:hypothetical protein
MLYLVGNGGALMMPNSYTADAFKGLNAVGAQLS